MERTQLLRIVRYAALGQVVRDEESQKAEELEESGFDVHPTHHTKH
jgi:hypothetical protein